MKKVQKNSYLVKLDLHCAYGTYRTQKLADSHQKREALTQTERAPGSRISKCAREDSCKVGCLYRISIVQYALWPWATCITLQSIELQQRGMQCKTGRYYCRESKAEICLPKRAAKCKVASLGSVQ